MRKLKAVIPALALVAIMALPVQAAGAETRAGSCWCGGSYSNTGIVSGMSCRTCGGQVYRFVHNGFLHSATSFECLSGHQN